MCDLVVEDNNCCSDPILGTKMVSSSSSPIHLKESQENPEKNGEIGEKEENPEKNGEIGEKEENPEKNCNNGNSNSGSSNNVAVRRERPSRACTQRAVQRMQEAVAAEARMAAADKKRRAAKRRERLASRVKDEEEEDEGEVEEEVEEEEGGGDEHVVDDGGEPSSSRGKCTKVVTKLVGEPEDSQLPRWNIRGMWELASILNFLNVCDF